MIYFIMANGINTIIDISDKYFYEYSSFSSKKNIQTFVKMLQMYAIKKFVKNMSYIPLVEVFVNTYTSLSISGTRFFFKKHVFKKHEAENVLSLRSM